MRDIGHEDSSLSKWFIIKQIKIDLWNINFYRSVYEVANSLPYNAYNIKELENRITQIADSPETWVLNFSVCGTVKNTFLSFMYYQVSDNLL